MSDSKPDGTPRGVRTLHCLDPENECGTGNVSAAQFRAWWDAYRLHAVGVREGDQVISGASPRSAARMMFALDGDHRIQWRIRDGRNGAERAVLDTLDIDHVAKRFGRLVIASGDGAWAPLAREARALGMDVVLVIGVGAPARRLLKACPTHVRIRNARRAPWRNTSPAASLNHLQAIAA